MSAASTPLGGVLARLGPVKKNGTGYMATCPAHPDRTPSLSVSEGDDGRVLLNCRAGCDVDAVLARLKLDWSDLFAGKPTSNSHRREEVARYPYVDEHGAVLFEVVRFREPDGSKTFRQRRPDGNDGWLWNMAGVRRVIYRLPQVLAAVAAGHRVWVAEGEKDVHALERAGEVATTNPGGAGKWGKVPDAAAALAGAGITVVADRDEPGRRHACEVAQDLRSHGCTVRVVEAASGKDAADHLGAGRTLAEFVPVESGADSGAEQEGASRAETGGAKESRPSDEKETKKSASTQLVELAQAAYSFGVSDQGDTYAIPRSGPKVTSMLRGGKTSLRAMLAREYFRQTGRAAPQQALADALAVLEGMAQDEPAEELHLRVAELDGATWLDLGDSTGRAVRVTGQGWTVEPEAPVLFRRTTLNAPLPEPVPGGDIEELWSWLNVSVQDRPLVLAWLISALRPRTPHPVLDLSGEQGSGKTTAQKVLVSLVDPGPVPTRKPPRDADSWVTAASGSWVVGLDNLSAMPDWLSDSLCRGVTGDGDVRRKLYFDADFVVFAFRRCVIITGIDLGAVNGDLADRLLPVHLDIIPGDRRLEEDEMWPRWREAHPRLLGALLTSATSVTRTLPSVTLTTKPRMADFARVVAAVDNVYGTDGLARYLAKQGSLASESLTGDAFVVALQEVGSFEGTSAELLSQVEIPDRPPKGWPANARQVTQLLRRQAPSMRKAGWTVDDDGAANVSNALRWVIAHPEMARNPDSSHSSHSSDSAVTSVTSVTSVEYAPSQDDEGTGSRACDRCHQPTERTIRHYASGARWCPSCCHEAP